ncbi:MAG: class I SAM-dependent methyltransferase, partial [Planctomycetota bacterium]
MLRSVAPEASPERTDDLPGPRDRSFKGPQADRVVKRLRRLPRRIAARRRLAIRDRRAGQEPVEDRAEGVNRDLTRRLYDGPAGAVLAWASAVSLHEPLIGQLLRAAPGPRGVGRRSPRFDVSQFENVLDVGSGAGQILGHLIREAAPEARLTAFDLSTQMLRRSRKRMEGRAARHGRGPRYVAGDMLRMPFA